MKSVTGWALTGAALLMLAVPMAAQAQEWGGGWRRRDIARDHHHLRHQWRDIEHDRFALRRDLASGNWGAAEAERQDIRRDFMNVHRQRRDLYRDYQGFPGPGANRGYLPPPPNYGPRYMGYLPGSSIAYPPLASYGTSAAPYYPSLPPNYAALPAQNPGGLLGLLSGGNPAMVPGLYPGAGAAPYYPNVPANYAGVPAQNPGGLLSLLSGGNAMIPGSYSGNPAASYYPNGPSPGLGALLGNIIR